VARRSSPREGRSDSSIPVAQSGREIEGMEVRRGVARKRNGKRGAAVRATPF
jgi:hypothetical protein